MREQDITTSDSPGDELAGRHVLVAEDEFLLAFDIRMRVEELGCAVLGPAGSIEKALELLTDKRPDAALLDVNLRGRPVTPVALACRNAGIPFVLVTTYLRSQIKEPLLQSAPIVNMPFTPPQLARAIRHALDGDAGD